MSRTLKVELAVPNALSVDGLVSMFQDFGEDVYRALRDECEVSIDEIDHFVGAFHLRRLHKREVRSISGKVRKVLEQYPALTDVKIYEIQDDDVDA
jgi:hypothetical protein